MKNVVQSLENTGSSFWEKRQTANIDTAVNSCLSHELFSLCESVCVSSLQNVVLMTPTVAGTTTEEVLCNFKGVYMSVCFCQRDTSLQLCNMQS